MSEKTHTQEQNVQKVELSEQELDKASGGVGGFSNQANQSAGTQTKQEPLGNQGGFGSSNQANQNGFGNQSR